LLTSAAVRPQPWQISSNKVEQMPMQAVRTIAQLRLTIGIDGGGRGK
jgi:hypothetical protein